MARRKTGPETGTIDSVTHDGRGIVAGDGKKVFVAGALAGEEVRYQRRKRRRNFDEAELLEVLAPSPERVVARCAAFGRCGGCSLQHVSTDQQREIKGQALKDNLERIGHVIPENWLEPVVGTPWNYRRRARLAVKDVFAKGRVLVGFRERHAPFITDMHRCEVLAEPLDGWIDPLSELIGELTIRARIPQVEIAIGENAIALVFRVLDEPPEDDLAKLAAFGRERDADMWLQPGGLDSLRPVEDGQCSPELIYTLPEFEVEVAFQPLDFVQVNAGINRRMVGLAIELLAPEAGDRVLDLYCGIGNFSLPLARRSAEVLGIEGESSLVERARENARRNALENVDFAAADLSELNGSEPWLRRGWDRMLLDPARSGAASVVSNCRHIGASRIVYVSCHPGTLARDAGALVHEHGYRLESAGIIDMFPHTAHVESVAVFTK